MATRKRKWYVGTVGTVEFRYDAVNGDLYRKLQVCYQGQRPGEWRLATPSVSSNGYAVIGIGGKRITTVHRLVLTLAHGELAGHVDHINGVRTDNRLCNLRVVTQRENNQRIRPRQEKASKFKGVTRSNSSAKNPWAAQISVDGKSHHLGVFPTEEEAARAFDRAALRIRGKRTLTNKELKLYGG